jgi:putative methyltransferase (TIGR04325 family)
MSALKTFVPPVLVALARRRLFGEPKFVWEGVYDHYRDVPVQPASYDDEIEVKKHYNWTRAALEQIHEGKAPYLWHRVLAVVAAMVSSTTGSVRVLDFGGAVGTGYVQLLATLPKHITIDYRVVDLEKMCAVGRQLFCADARISFDTALAAEDTSLDIVYLNGALCYIEDYRDLLTKLASLQAKFMLFVRLATGDIPTYATKQVNLANKTLAYWFINRSEFLGILTSSGYSLVYEDLDDQEFNQDEFPEVYRIGRMRVMLFRRSSDNCTSVNRCWPT